MEFTLTVGTGKDMKKIDLPETTVRLLLYSTDKSAKFTDFQWELLKDFLAVSKIELILSRKMDRT